MAEDQQNHNSDPPNPANLASGSPTVTKAAMKEVLTELFSEVPGLKELMEKPPTASLPSQGLLEDQTKRKQLHT